VIYREVFKRREHLGAEHPCNFGTTCGYFQMYAVVQMTLAL
jgi:hypothetical protein